jgi:putative nucleotidyltransferase with HDIG domain
MIEAPGTYQHSLVVANLAESAAESVGANAAMAAGLLVFSRHRQAREAGVFRGNMRRDRNPHDELAPTMSALIIIAHVKEGVDLALKNGLNQQIIDVISNTTAPR